MYGMWSSDEFDETSDYIIIDDCDFDFMNPAMRKGFWGAQEIITTRDLYRKGVARWGKPCIWLCNDDTDPFTAQNKKTQLAVMAPVEIDWYRANSTYVRITDPLYREI